jgi:hypothetical protein
MIAGLDRTFFRLRIPGLGSFALVLLVAHLASSAFSQTIGTTAGVTNFGRPFN